VELIDEQILVYERAAAQQRNYTPLRPSSAGKCMMELGYEYMEYRGKSKPIGDVTHPELARIFALGHSVEAHVLNYIRKITGYELKYAQQCLTLGKLADGTPIEGSLDFCLYSAEHRMIVDVKSKKDSYSASHQSKWDETSQAYAHMGSVTRVTPTLFWIENLPDFLAELKDEFLARNFIQLNLYATADFILERQIYVASILQYNKSDSRMREFRFRPDKSTAQARIDAFRQVAHAVDQIGSIDGLTREFQPGSRACAYCKYATKCRPHMNTKEAFYATLPPKKWPAYADSGAETLYQTYKELQELSDLQMLAEEKLCSHLFNQGIQKVKFQDGAIFEVKYLKTPKPHMCLRRSKL